MWTQGTLCQLASELESGQRHVLYRWSLRVFLLYQVLCFLSCCHLSISFILQITKRIPFLCQVSSLSALLTDQSLPLAGLFPLLFDFDCSALPSYTRLPCQNIAMKLSRTSIFGFVPFVRYPISTSVKFYGTDDIQCTEVPRSTGTLQSAGNVVLHIKIHQMFRGRTFSPIITFLPRKMNL